MKTIAVLTLVLSLTALPRLGDAQNLEAVERKLGEAVAEGDLSLEQAAAMMETLYDHTHQHGDENEEVEEQIVAWVDKVGDRIRNAVKEGSLSGDEGWEKWKHFKKHELRPKLRHVVDEGLVREEWADEFRQGIERAEIGEKLKTSVARGEITEEEAWTKWAELEGHVDSEKEHRARNEDETGVEKMRLERLAKRTRREAESRSAKENRMVAEALERRMEEAREQGNRQRARMLELQLRAIRSVLEEER